MWHGPQFGTEANDPAHVRESVSSTGDCLLAGLARPDTDRLALHGRLAAKGACVARMLADFHLLHLLTQRGTISVPIRQIRFRRCVPLDRFSIVVERCEKSFVNRT